MNYREGLVDFGYTQVPVSERQQKVNGMFHRIARVYDIMNDLMSFGLHRTWKSRLIVSFLSPHLSTPQPPERVWQHLDVAAGTGDVAFRVIQAMEREKVMGQVVLTDISPSMLAVATSRAKQYSSSSYAKLSIREENAEALSFPDQSFHSYSIAFGIRNVTDRDAALRQAFRSPQAFWLVPLP